MDATDLSGLNVIGVALVYDHSSPQARSHRFNLVSQVKTTSYFQVKRVVVAAEFALLQDWRDRAYCAVVRYVEYGGSVYNFSLFAMGMAGIQLGL